MSGMSKAPLIAGLDVGQNTTKLVVVRRGRGGAAPRVVHTAILDNRQEGILSEEELAEHLSGWLNDQKHGSADTVIGLPQYLCSAQVTDFPPNERANLDDLVLYETQHLAGLSDEAFVHGYSRLEPFEGHPNPVLIGVCREAVVRRRLDLLAEAAAQPADLVMEGQALCTAYTQLEPAKARQDGLRMLLNIGAENTTVALMQHGDIVFLGAFMFGGDNFTTALRRDLNVSEREAERTKLDSRLVPGDLNSTLVQTAREFVSELTLALENYHHEEDAALKIEEIAVCGGGALLDGLPEYLAVAFDCQVALLKAPEAPAGTHQTIPVVAWGLALHGVDAHGTVDLSLAPDDVKWINKRRREIPLLVIAAMVFALALGGYLALTYYALRGELARLETKQNNLQACSRIIPEVEANRKAIESLQAMLQPFAARGGRNHRFVNSVELLSRYQDDKDWLVLIADPASYTEHPETFYRALPGIEEAEGDTRERPRGGPFAAPADATGAELPLVSTTVRPWTHLYASGFTPYQEINPLARVQATIDRLNNEKDSIFTDVDIMQEGEYSDLNLRLKSPWQGIFKMRSYTLRLPFKQLPFEPPPEARGR